MARNEKTSKKIASMASKALRGKPMSKQQVKSFAGSLLTQTSDKKKKKS